MVGCTCDGVGVGVADCCVPQAPGVGVAAVVGAGVEGDSQATACVVGAGVADEVGGSVFHATACVVGAGVAVVVGGGVAMETGCVVGGGMVKTAWVVGAGVGAASTPARSSAAPGRAASSRRRGHEPASAACSSAHTRRSSAGPSSPNGPLPCARAAAGRRLCRLSLLAPAAASINLTSRGPTTAPALRLQHACCAEAINRTAAAPGSRRSSRAGHAARHDPHARTQRKHSLHRPRP